MPSFSTRPPVLDLIGQTPLLELPFRKERLRIFAKAEFLNPSGSIKDRLARHIIEHAEENGMLQRDSIILECTSGNTGISLSLVGAAKGYRVKILMSRTASIERRNLIRHLGGEIELFEPTQGYATGIHLAQQMAENDSRYFLPRQFENPLNAEDHERGTALEILRQVPGQRVDAFVSGYGTGGTLTGCGRAIKRAHPSACVVAMEPAESAMLSGEMPCCHGIEGIAGGFVPPLVLSAPIDQRIKVSSEEALTMTQRLAAEYGLLVGTSSGANVCAALQMARMLGPDAQVVTILCDRAERYYSTRLFEASRHVDAFESSSPVASNSVGMPTESVLCRS
ncbi:cysteine synthase A [Haloferula luteola]|uniref:cysteine synthase n=1 Tax=Haloferula luteola TaxID=595692 RepID=A0A840V1X0_9BACT|nr:cysteine synthase family protein [Haloferula luteola]MBB5351985.1 cysteine synthase A [Haloferula luteola]